MSKLRQITESLEALRVSLLRLPSADQPSGPSYPFEGFIVDLDYLERTGSIQGSINHTLEVAFGSRADGKLICFRHHGPDLVAVVDVLAEGITGSEGENVILLKWVDDLHEAAKHAYTQLNLIDVDALPDETVKRTSKATMKRALIEQEASEKAMEKKQKVIAKERTESMRGRTQGKIHYDPNDVCDVTVERSNVGRRPDKFLEKVAISCELKSNPSKKLWRCSAKGCTHIRAYPRSSDRVLIHTLECEYFSPEIREQAAVAARDLSLVARIDVLDLKSTSNSNKGSTTQPSVKSAVQREGQERRSLKHNQLALLLVCGMSLPPTLVDSDYWKELANHLDPKVKGFSGSHLASALIPAEAARVRELSIIELRKYIHLKLSFDGATTRANNSVYTVHATTPDKRQAHLLAGDEVTGLSHTAEHLKAMLLRVIELVGIKHFSAVSSDNAGNTRLTRELLEEEFAWLIHFADACHQMHNTAKDIVALLVFSDANSKLRAVIRYFRKSSYATHHLTAWRHILNISKGLLTIGKTRFLMWFYAIDHFLPCLQIIVDLVRSKVIKTNGTHPLHFLNSTSATREFTDRLEQERAILEPFARAVKCLESSASTPADVCLFWLACQATLNDLFTDETKRDILMLTEDLIADVRAIVNARFGEMIEGPDRQVYLTTLFLDPHYLGSPLFTRKHINPLSTTISIPNNRSLGSSHATNTRCLPDTDLRASLPAYVSSGAYLGQILVNEINASRLPEEITSSYNGADAIVEEFRMEFESYTRQRPPFDRYTDSPTPFVYWTRQARHFDACVLAFLGLKLYSIVPNSMAEERTISNFTKLNSPDRGRQRPSTLVFMTQIKQHQQRERKAPGSAYPTKPTVRFRDLSDILGGQSTPATPEGAAGAATNQAHNAVGTPAQDGASASNSLGSADEDEWHKVVGLDEEIEQPPPGARDRFTFAEAGGVNLDEPLLLDLLSDEPVPGVVARGGYTINQTGNISATTTNSSASGSFAAKSFRF